MASKDDIILAIIFQFLIKGYTDLNGIVVIVETMFFQFLIKGYRTVVKLPLVASVEPFNSSLKDTSVTNLCYPSLSFFFQFLIKGY